jgi:hypothetical protein
MLRLIIQLREMAHKPHLLVNQRLRVGGAMTDAIPEDEMVTNTGLGLRIAHISGRGRATVSRTLSFDCARPQISPSSPMPCGHTGANQPSRFLGQVEPGCADCAIFGAFLLTALRLFSKGILWIVQP